MDCYNANPTSMNVALASFKRLIADRKGVILGDMLELGDTSLEEHRHVLARLREMDLEFNVVVGKEFQKAAIGSGINSFPGVNELRHWLSSVDMANTHVLLKGSRAIGLERIVE